MTGNKAKQITLGLIALNALIILFFVFLLLYDGLVSTVLTYGLYSVFSVSALLLHIAIGIACFWCLITERLAIIDSENKWTEIIVFALYAIYHLFVVSITIFDVLTNERYHLMSSMPMLPAYLLSVLVTCYLLLVSYKIIKPKWVYIAVIAITIILGFALWYWHYPFTTPFAKGNELTNKFLIYYTVMFLVIPILSTPLYLAFLFQSLLPERKAHYQAARVAHLYYWYFMVGYWIILFLVYFGIGFTP